MKKILFLLTLIINTACVASLGPLPKSPNAERILTPTDNASVHSNNSNISQTSGHPKKKRRSRIIRTGDEGMEQRHWWGC